MVVVRECICCVWLAIAVIIVVEGILNSVAIVVVVSVVTPAVTVCIPLLSTVSWEVVRSWSTNYHTINNNIGCIVTNTVVVVIGICVVTGAVTIAVNPLIRVSWEGIVGIDPTISIIVCVNIVVYAITVKIAVRVQSYCCGCISGRHSLYCAECISMCYCHSESVAHHRADCC